MHVHVHEVNVKCTLSLSQYCSVLFYCYYFCSRVGAEGRDAVIDVLIKVIPKNKLAVELFVKLGGELLWGFNFSLPAKSENS